MAVLQKIRNRAGLLIGVLGLALLAFILSDVLTSSKTFLNMSKDNAFEVDGDVISTGDYKKRIDEYDAFYKYLSGEKQQGESAAQANEDVYQAMVKEIMLDKEAKKLGLTVTSEELTSLVYGTRVSPLFMYDEEISQIFVNQQTSRFDQALLIQFLTSIREDVQGLTPQQEAQLTAARSMWAYIENRIKYHRLEEKYTWLIASAFTVNDKEAKIAYDDSRDVATFTYAYQPYATLSDSSVQVSDSEIASLYEKRKANFKLNADLRKVSYFVEDLTPSEEDFAEVRTQMDAAKEKLREANDYMSVRNISTTSPYSDVYYPVSILNIDPQNFVKTGQVGDIYGPVINGQNYIMYKCMAKTIAADSIELQQIILPALDIASVDIIADSLINVIKGGKSFATVAKEISQNPQAGEPTMISELNLHQMNIDKQCFAASRGEILKLSVRGETWLLRIGSKNKPVAKAKLAMITMPVDVSDRTLSLLDNELNQFISESGNMQDFNKAAASKGYDLVADAMISPSLTGLQNVGDDSRDIIRWAFNNEVGKIEKFDLPRKRVVAIVLQEIKKGFVPTSDPLVGEVLKNELIRDKKAEKIIADLKAKNITSLDAYAQSMESKIDTMNFVSFQSRDMAVEEPLFNAYAKVGQVNKLEGPLKGNAGIYTFTMTDKSVDAQEYNPEMSKMMISRETFGMQAQSLLLVLREKMGIEDNRVKFW